MEFQAQPQPEKGNLIVSKRLNISSGASLVIKIILEVIGAILILSIFLMLAYFGDSISRIMKEQTSLPAETSKKEEPPKITLPKVLYNLAGPIKELGAGMLILEAEIPLLTEEGQLTQKIESRKVLITPTTKFTRLTFVAQPGTNQKTPQETIIAFKDLKVKDYIEVVSNQDISEAPEFQATQIRVLPR